mmetsp:Transcript_77033/g.168386  ORF Transcript_77033/g.168386 Transcript_77033/m.168386 type:complete len:90 (+) Transcript_77033:309-578(+)
MVSPPTAEEPGVGVGDRYCPTPAAGVEAVVWAGGRGGHLFEMPETATVADHESPPRTCWFGVERCAGGDGDLVPGQCGVLLLLWFALLV